jgi:predicted esterase
LSFVALTSACAPTPAVRAPRASVEEPAAATRSALAIPGFLPAIVSLPDPARGPRPLLVIAHGAGGRPEDHCDFWAPAFAERAVMLCLRGAAEFPRRADTGYYFPDHHALERELLAALDALEREHASAIAPGPAVYMGFSQGAIMGALVAAQHPERFRRLILIEGGYDEWSVASARRFAARGDARVLLVCGVSHCERHARRSLRSLLRGGVAARLEATRAGHTYGDEVAERVQGAFQWVTEGDERWR